VFKGLVLKSSIIAFACSVSVCAFAMADTPRQIDVPAGALAHALELISKQAGVELVFRPEHVAGLRTNGVVGTFSAQEAVKKLLEGTSLQVQADDATGAMMIGRDLPPASPRHPSTETKSSAAPSEKETSKREPPTSSRADGFWSRFRLAQAEGTPGAAAAVNPPDRGNDARPNDAAALEEVLVTGTHIRGIDNLTVPLTILDRQFIDSTGLTTTVQLIESLPQNFALTNQTITGGALSGNSFSSIQGSSINLRGIGEGTTLTLVNGRRMPLGYDGSAVNIAALPLSALDRVEVLTDGASAFYGSDAVGGVVNFVFRKDFDGAESRAAYGHADGTDDYRLSQTLGTHWGSGNIVAVAEHYSRDILLASDRDFVTHGGTTVPSLLPEEKNTAVTLYGRQEIGKNAEVFLDALYTHRDSYNKSFEASVTSDADIYIDNDQVAVNAGVDLKLGPTWRGEVSVGYGADDLENEVIDPPAPRVYAYVPILSKFTSVDAKADGPLFELPGGTVRVAVGAHRRKESHDYEQSGYDAQMTRINHFQFHRERNVSSLFAEASVPIVGARNAARLAQRVELSLAARYDDYSDFGSSVDPRIGLAWVPVNGLKLRGSWGTSFLAPKMKDYDPSFNATLAVDNFFLANDLNVMQMSGNATEELEAQESKNYTLGIDFAPAALPGFKMSVNYYDIDYRDKIEDPSTIPFTSILANPAAFSALITLNPTVDQVNAAIQYGQTGQGFYALNPDFTPNANFDPSNVDALFDMRRRNIGVLGQSGFDVSTSYDFDVGASHLRVGFDLAYINEIEKQVTATSEAFDVLDTYAHPTHLRARLGFGYTRGGWALNTFVHRRNAYVDNRLTPAVGIDEYTTVDLNVGYTFPQSNGLLSDVRVQFSSVNLFDKDPPLAAARGPGYYDLGFDSTNASVLKRLLTLDLTKRW
jgi:outer membrane receptor protein involved in Fe transport